MPIEKEKEQQIASKEDVMKLSGGELSSLRRNVEKHFSTEELQNICFDIGIDWQELDGGTKFVKTVSLVAYLHAIRPERLENFLALLQEAKPNVRWLSGSSGTQRVTKDSSPELVGLSIPDATLQEVLYINYPEVWTEIVQLRLYKKKLNLSDLLNKIRDAFDDSEFRDLCFALEVSYGQLAGGHYYDKARELIAHCKRNGKLNDLIKLCKELRPFIIWDYE